jgi:acyl-CoA synthetase (AMP-forming)/AMP-acid ligase II
MLIHSLLADAATDVPDSPAVRDRWGTWTYGELLAFSRAFETWLRERGVARGDRVVVQVPTTREAVAMLFGTSLRGAVFVPLNPGMKQFHVRAVVDNAEPRLVIRERPDASGVEHAFEQAWSAVEPIRGNPSAAEPALVEPDDIALLIYTSGSTSVPKGVIGPHAPVVFAANAIHTVLGYRPEDVVFCRFPLSWDYGLYKVLLSCLGRSELVLAGEESDLTLLQRMREVGTTIVPIVPSLAAMIIRLAERDSGAMPPVRMFTNTGAALPSATIAKLRTLFPGAHVVRQFGQTECKRISIMPPGGEDRPGAVGLPLPGTAVSILDAQGRELPTGQIGEIVVSGPHVMPGYWRVSELTARTFRRDERTGALRLHTGDYGRLDRDGYLYFEGRRDDMFKRKGIRMSTLEIEAAAMDIPGVRAAAAIPPTEQRDLTLYVETELAPHVVLRELATRLEPAKVPASCHAVEELPLSAHGKNATRQLARLPEVTGR